MNRKKIIISLFIVAAVVQLAVPLSMIVKRETTLKNGRQVKFKTAPVDPYDAFRGRYVALRMEATTVPVEQADNWQRGERAHVIFGEDEKGFARFVKASREKPKGNDYISLEVNYVYGGTNLNLRLPFDRYYMNEKDAPAAERAYNAHSRREQMDAYVTVRVLNGFAILEELYIADTPVVDFIRKNEN